MRWHESLVKEERRLIKAELDAVGEKRGIKERLRHIMLCIGQLEAAPASRDHLRRYIFVISALVHHERNGGLTDAQVRGLIEIAHAILRVQGIHPTTSNLSFLYGDLHQIVSQIERQRGEHWKSAWELQLALQSSRRRDDDGGGFQALSIGIRALRLGHVPFALAHFSEAARDLALPTTLRRRASLYEAKSLRLSRRLDEAAGAAHALSSEKGLSAEEELEIEWESICTEALRTSDLAPMVRAVQRGKPHGISSYFCEAFFWTVASRRTAWMERLPSLRTLTDAKVLAPRALGPVFQSMRAFEQCYDNSYPLAARIRNLGEVLGQTRHLVAIDHELLVWLGATRWLARNNVFTVAALAAREYRALSLRVSDGKAADALGIAADLEERPWTHLKPSA